MRAQYEQQPQQTTITSLLLSVIPRPHNSKGEEVSKKTKKKKKP